MSDSVPMIGPLVVSSKVLGHISEGLYRGPSGVLKELIANAFDANATTVWINTGRPVFDVVSVRDDGEGMSLGEFQRVVSGGIGDSEKRIEKRELINGRDVIGRLGVGMLGVSQISHEFSITSHDRRTKTAFRAEIQMRDFRSQILDQGEDSGAGEELVSVESAGFSVGGYSAECIPFDEERVGTTIVATDPTEGFREQLSEDDPEALPRDFRMFCEKCKKKDFLATGSWYNRMIWQLASLSPVSYMPGSIGSSGDDTMLDIMNRLRHFAFNVIVDGVKIFKPLILDGHPTVVAPGEVGDGRGPFHFPLFFDEAVWGTRLRSTGYIYGSAGTVLHPDDIRGVIVRIRHVGIGGYDKSFLGYRYAEGPRFAWLTGEIFIEDGLEDALTVGRDGFDIGHPHYIALRKWLHTELQKRVFPTLYRSISARRKSKEESHTTARRDAFLEEISAFADRTLVIRETKHVGPPIRVDLSQGVVSVNPGASWPRGKRQRELAINLGIIYELVRQINTGRDPIEEFILLTQKHLLQR